jgi:hypothetical protein
MMKSLGLLLLFTLTVGSDAFMKRKVKRVQAGKVYKEHDDVHLVVNKVGCVSCCSLRRVDLCSYHVAHTQSLVLQSFQ